RIVGGQKALPDYSLPVWPSDDVPPADGPTSGIINMKELLHTTDDATVLSWWRKRLCDREDDDLLLGRFWNETPPGVLRCCHWTPTPQRTNEWDRGNGMQHFELLDKEDAGSACSGKKLTPRKRHYLSSLQPLQPRPQSL